MPDVQLYDRIWRGAERLTSAVDHLAASLEMTAGRAAIPVQARGVNPASRAPLGAAISGFFGRMKLGASRERTYTAAVRDAAQAASLLKNHDEGLVSRTLVATQLRASLEREVAKLPPLGADAARGTAPPDRVRALAREAVLNVVVDDPETASRALLGLRQGNALRALVLQRFPGAEAGARRISEAANRVGASSSIGGENFPSWAGDYLSRGESLEGRVRGNHTTQWGEFWRNR